MILDQLKSLVVGVCAVFALLIVMRIGQALMETPGEVRGALAVVSFLWVFGWLLRFFWRGAQWFWETTRGR